MKKVLIIAILALNVVSLSYLAMSQRNQPFAIKSAIAELDCSYIENTSNCTKEIDGTGKVLAGASLSAGNFFFDIPIDWDFDTQGIYTLTYTDVKVTCSLNGTTTCEPFSCASFWIQMANAN